MAINWAYARYLIIIGYIFIFHASQKAGIENIGAHQKGDQRYYLLAFRR